MTFWLLKACQQRQLFFSMPEKYALLNSFALDHVLFILPAALQIPSIFQVQNRIHLSFFFSLSAPCCPNDLTLVQVTQSVTNISWSAGRGAQTYVTALESPKGQAKCHTLQTYCLLGCITCGTNYSVSLRAISETGLTSSCTYQGYSSST